MRLNKRMAQPLLVSLGLACSGLLSISPVPAQQPKERATLLGHTSAVRGVAFSPDGRTIASASDDGTVKLWDVLIRKEIGSLEGHTARVRCVAFSPDGRMLATGSVDSTIKLWEVVSQTARATFEGHDSTVTAVDFSPDGKMLASGSFDSTIKLWNAAKGSCIATFKDGEGLLGRSVAFSPEGKMLASVGGDKSIRLWDVDAAISISARYGRKDQRVLREILTGGAAMNVATLDGHGDWVTSVAFTPNGKTLASGGGHTVKLWDVSLGLTTARLDVQDYVMCIAFSPDGATLATGGGTTIKLWDVFSAKERASFQAHEKEINPATGKRNGFPTSLAFSPDGTMLVSGSAGATVKLWDLKATK